MLNFNTIENRINKKLIPLIFCVIVLIMPSKLQAQNPTDCVNSIIVCGDSDINLNVSGLGTQELTGNVCNGLETNSLWLKVTLVTAGTLAFTLTPGSTAISEDYDFYVFGPNVQCTNLGQAIRCSTTNPQAAGLSDNLTGMNSIETDPDEGPGADGNSFVSDIDVLAGESYFIIIDRPIGNSSFSLDWTGTAAFSPPPTDQSTAGSLDLESCDLVNPFDDTFTVFDLEQN